MNLYVKDGACNSYPQLYLRIMGEGEGVHGALTYNDMHQVPHFKPPILGHPHQKIPYFLHMSPKDPF